MNDDDETPRADGQEGRAASLDDAKALERVLAGVLAEPAVWTELDPGIEDRIVAAISAESAARVAGEPQEAGEAATILRGADDEVPVLRPVGGVARSSTTRRWVGPIAAGIAAALILIVGFAALTREAADTDGVDLEVAMEATDLAPDARADLGIETTPIGTRLVLDVSGLPPAPEGKVYEAWMRKDATIGVSAGTFHMRGGDGELELWSGVLVDDYPLITVTLQDEADPISSGEVVLRALVEQ